MLWTIITGPSYREAKEDILNSSELSQGFEIRVDTFEKIEINEIATLLSLTSLPVLMTFPKVKSGVWEKLLDLQPDWIDLDLETPHSLFKRVKKEYPDIKILLSHHNYEGTPSWEEILNQMMERKADGYKIVGKVFGTLESLKVLEFVRKKSFEGVPLTCLCLGEAGTISRILNPIFGNQFNYAPCRKKTAEGQLFLQELSETYSYFSLNKETKLFGLIGNPIEKSPSHITHNALFRKFNLNSVYVKIPLKEEELEPSLDLMKRLGFAGLSITMPYKERIQDLTGYHSPVNTLHFSQGSFKPYNTDGEAVLDLIERKISVENRRFLILGTGGAAQASAQEAKKRGGVVTLVGRKEEKLKKLRDNLKVKTAYFHEMETLFQAGYEILINGTSIGMTPVSLDYETPIDPKWVIPGTVVVDMVYFPHKTELLSQAEKRGCKIIFGIEMFALQAAKQFKILFNEEKNEINAKEISEEILKVLDSTLN